MGALKKAEEEAAALKKAEEAATLKKAEEEAAALKKAEEEAAVLKKAEEEAAALKKAEESTVILVSPSESTPPKEVCKCVSATEASSPGSDEVVKIQEDALDFKENNPEIVAFKNNLAQENKENSILLPETPVKGSSSRVQDYLKSIPTPLKNDNKDITALTEITSHAAPFEEDDDSKNVSLDALNDSMTPEKDDISLPGSLASSKMTGLSSLMSSRIGSGISGMMYGMVAPASQP